MASNGYRFGEFTLDARAHRLARGAEDVPLSPRCFDLLLLFVRHSGELLTKDRIFEQVWAGVTVGDEALTQAVKEVRKALGDDAAAPRFIETVPKRGYRFIAEVEHDIGAVANRGHLDLVLAGTIGGGIAGIAGGLAYGLAAGIGSESALAILLVMTTITCAIALLGALALSLGMAAASRIAGQRWIYSAIGAGLAGFVVGEAFHLVATSSFSLLIGQSHAAFTGGLEGLLLGAGIALGAHLAGGATSVPRIVTLGGALGGGIAGAVISLLGGKLMATSLATLARTFHGAELDLGLFGMLGAGEGAVLVQALVATGEGLLFGACVAGAIAYRLSARQP